MFLKNKAVTGFAVGFINATSGAAVTAGTPTGTYTLDGGAQTAIAGAFVHEGLGLWTVNLTAGEMNGTIVGLTFSLTDAINVYFTIKTVLYDPDNATTLGLTNLDAAVTTRATPTNITAATGIVLSGVTHTGAVIPTVSAVTGLTAANLDAAVSTRATPTNITAATGIVLSGVTHTGAVIPTVSVLTGHTAQTGDNFARLGAPAGTSVSADVAAIKAETVTILGDTNDIQTRLPSALVGGRMDSNASAINNVATSAARLALSTQGIVTATVGAGSTVTSVVTSALDPAAAVIDQFKGRIITFKHDTATVNLRGQSTDITTNTAAGVLTVTALTTAPASGDTFVIT